MIVVLRYTQSSPDVSEDSSALKGFEVGRDESDSMCPLL